MVLFALCCALLCCALLPLPLLHADQGSLPSKQYGVSQMCSSWGDEEGMLALVTTFAPMMGNLQLILMDSLGDQISSIVVLRLHEFTSERSLTSE